MKFGGVGDVVLISSKTNLVKVGFGDEFRGGTVFETGDGEELMLNR